MAKRRRKRARKTTVKARRCKQIKVQETKAGDRVKIGARTYRAKHKVMDVGVNGKIWACPVGKGWTMQTSTGTLSPLYKTPKRR